MNSWLKPTNAFVAVSRRAASAARPRSTSGRVISLMPYPTEAPRISVRTSAPSRRRRILGRRITRGTVPEVWPFLSVVVVLCIAVASFKTSGIPWWNNSHPYRRRRPRKDADPRTARSDLGRLSTRSLSARALEPCAIERDIPDNAVNGLENRCPKDLGVRRCPARASALLGLRTRPLVLSAWGPGRESAADHRES
jgi:hypothetical protein